MIRPFLDSNVLTVVIGLLAMSVMLSVASVLDELKKERSSETEGDATEPTASTLAGLNRRARTLYAQYVDEATLRVQPRPMMRGSDEAEEASTDWPPSSSLVSDSVSALVSALVSSRRLAAAAVPPEPIPTISREDALSWGTQQLQRNIASPIRLHCDFMANEYSQVLLPFHGMTRHRGLANAMLILAVHAGRIDVVVRIMAEVRMSDARPAASRQPPAASRQPPAAVGRDSTFTNHQPLAPPYARPNRP